MEEKLGQEPAFPCINESYIQEGMSKRFYAACIAIQGILASNECGIGHNPSTAVEWAYSIADELLKQERK